MGLIHEATGVEQFCREAFLYFLQEWDVLWQTQEYLRRQG